MSGRRGTRPIDVVPRLALNRDEAAASLGVSLTFFEDHIQGELRLIRVGRKRLVPMAELERFTAENAAFAIDGDPAGH